MFDKSVSDNRLAILQATQKGESDKIKILLTQTPELIDARTTTKDSSLLHIAAERGHEDICTMLLENGHSTNPVDKEGKTAWQRAKSQNIKSLVASRHKDFLCKKYFYAAQVEILPKDFIGKVTEEVSVLNEDDFLQWLQTAQPGYLQDYAFISACTYLKLEKDPHSNGKYLYQLNTVFREDIFMLPYYGDVLVIHENEQVHQHKELLNEAEKVFDPNKVKQALGAMFESRAFLTSSSRGIDLFPFLAQYPTKEDRPEIVEAKKIFIAFNLIGGFDEFFPQCNEEIQNNLKELYEYKNLINCAGDILANPKSAVNMRLFMEMHNKYGLKKCESPLQL